MAIEAAIESLSVARDTTLGSDGMPETPYLNRDIRDRIEVVSDRVTRTEGRQEGHERLCAERYREILEKIIQMKADMVMYAKVGFVLAICLLGVEFGKATFPAIFEAITHVAQHGVP